MSISKRFDILKASVKKYKMGSLFVKNFLIVLLVVMIPLDIISLLFYANSSNSMRDKIDQTNYNYTYTIHNMTDNIMKEMKSLSAVVASQNDVTNYLFDKPAPNSVSRLQEDVSRYCKNFTYTHTYIDSIYIYCEATNTVLADYETQDFDTFLDTQWFSDYENINELKTEIVLRARNDYYPYFLSIIKPIFATDSDRIGAVVINVNIQKMAKIFANLDIPANQNIYILDKNNKIIYSENQNEILCDSDSIPLLSAINNAIANNSSSVNHEGADYIYSSIQSRTFDWRYVSAVPMSFYLNSSSTVTLLLITLLTVSLIIGAIISFYISTRTYRPIGNIMELISSPETTAPLYSDAPKNESAYILNQISKTLTSNRELKEELDIRLTLLKHAQIVTLQSQINPHFLFNTLDTINWMAIDGFEGENEVSDALTTLGDLFKLNIDTANYLTNLQSEIDYTKKYIEILQLRHKNIFNVHWNIEENLGECKVPRLVLQPLIENAIYHGIKPKLTPGTVDVEISSVGNHLTIMVTDDGVGLDPNYLDNLQKELEKDYIFGGKHVGLKNINQRIKLIYGNEYGLKVNSEPGKTEVRLTMPNIE